MNAPSSKTVRNLNGHWVLNKELTGDFNDVMRLQGLSWLSRKAVNMAQVASRITLDDSGPSTTFTLANTALNLKGTVEARTLNWEWREFKDYIWGDFKDRSRYVQKQDLRGTVREDAAVWLDELQGDDATLIESEVHAVSGLWSNHMIWGFKTIDGKRYFVRHMEVTRGSEQAHAVLVYDYRSE